MKKRFLMRRGLLAGAVLVAGGGGALALGATPAGASSVEVTTVGSFTTYVVMHDLFPTSLNDLLPGGTTSHQKIVATAKLCATGVTYNATSKVPNGSTAGKAALHNEESAAADEQGCVDFARSSSPPKYNGTSSTHFDYYAYALDGVAPMVGKDAGGSRTAPVTLTLTDMKNIYRCKPGFTNWKTVTGGTTAPIVRFWPQTGSGTRSVYTNILGYTAGKDHATTAASTCTTGAITTVTVTGHAKVNEENSEEGMIYYASTHVTAPIAGDLYIYSAGKFEQQWNTTTNYGKTHINSVTGTTIGNFNASTLLLAQMQNRTNASLTAPFANYAAPSGTFNATANRGLFTLNTGVIKEANEWYTHEPVATAKATASTSAVPGRALHLQRGRHSPAHLQRSQDDDRVRQPGLGDQEHPVQRGRLGHHHRRRLRAAEHRLDLAVRHSRQGQRHLPGVPRRLVPGLRALEELDSQHMGQPHIAPLHH